MPDDAKAQIQALLNDLPDAALQQWLAALQGAQPTQLNLGQATGFQVMVQGGTAYIGDQIHMDVATLAAALNELVAQRQPRGIPHNLLRSGAIKFVGRDDDLERVHRQLHESSQLAITALRGMGGIGKTELALQYALHHLGQGTYPGGICWLLAKDQAFGTEIVTFAQTHLGLTPPDGLELPAQVAYVWNHWPTTGDVLVVIDDVAGPNENAAYLAIKPYLPPQASRFWVLLTTRLQLGASIQTVQIDVLSKAASLELLRSLVGPERIDQELDTAKALCEWLGYLPLGLELVGRFLARKPGWTLAKMQEQLDAKRLEAKALTQAQPDMTAAHESLAAAFELSWQDLAPEAQELAYRLSLYALAPIVWEWIESWYDGTDPDDLEDWRDEGLASRSLLEVEADGDAETVQLHQIIREFFRAKLEQWNGADGLKRGYCRAMVQVAQQIPYTPTRDQILAVTPAIPHLAEAATTWRAWLEDESLGWPFTGLGRFYGGQGAYGQAEPWWLDLLAVVRDRLGEAHPNVATSLNNLAELYRSQGRYSEAEPLFQEALALRKQLLGEAHPDVATSLNNLAELYRSQGRYSEAEPLLQEALALRKQLLGEAHPADATDLNNLAMLYLSQGRYSEAEPLVQEALTLMKQLHGEAHPLVATSLNNLAGLYDSQGRYSEAEPLYQEALALRKQLLGEAHPDVATSLNNLAALYYSQGRYSEAEPLYQEALALRKQLLGEAHPDVATSLNNLALLYESQGRYSEAEPLYQEALALRKQLLGEAHPDVATSLNNLAGLYKAQGRYSEAEPLYLGAIEIVYQRLGETHPNTQTIFGNFVEFLQAVVAADQTPILSDHPLTQALLRQILS
ncbi:tetratricopeptide repeat protein [Leptolyngbya sp. KIOST-1]|uniref:tetratricopeptide repeat protein n=1 Tax=Leptolyngbya sp. KIOST-1 TaxID=1229172 RepID=UPI001CED3C0D|nr:tetratricopeptide repeat protein [Leptolyngbya sp. KIOST-1]